MTLKTIRLASAALLLCVCGSRALAANLVRNGSFEQPVVADGGFTIFSNGQSIGAWQVIGASGNVATVSKDFTQNGFHFPAKRGNQWLDLTGTSNSATGVQQRFATTPGATYSLTFFIGSVYDPGGIFATSSTVDVLVDGAQIAAFTNTSVPGTTTQRWRKFSTEFVAQGDRTTVALINGDPPSDTENGIDVVSVTFLSTP